MQCIHLPGEGSASAELAAHVKDDRNSVIPSTGRRGDILSGKKQSFEHIRENDSCAAPCASHPERKAQSPPTRGSRMDDQSVSTATPGAADCTGPSAAHSRKVRVLRPSVDAAGQPIPPSHVRKRPRGSVLQTVRMDVRARPSSNGLGWPCAECGALYSTRTGLFAHARFCAEELGKACSRCHASIGVSGGGDALRGGGRTLCAVCAATWRVGADGWLHAQPYLRADRKARESDQSEFVTQEPGGSRFFTAFRLPSGAASWHSAQRERGERSAADAATPQDERRHGKHTASIGKVRSGRASLPDAPKPRFACDFCRRIFDAAMALGSHQRYCDDGTWRCLLCECTFAETASKCHGPNGPRTLCVACSTRHRTSDASTAGRRPANAERPARAGTAAQDARGSLLCDGCERVFDKPHALRVHKRHCDGGTWSCHWCHCKLWATPSRGTGPAGPSTLCKNCSLRFRSGKSQQPQRDSAGDFCCECGRSFPSTKQLGSHRRFCKVVAQQAS